ncbi:uncharacterized protein [Nicotiana sylvestris]|uniref:uncharacterized protein n=1 Tax=Nicotiana sylvestris TaxID=4096 RepID=UPI00388C488E
MSYDRIPTESGSVGVDGAGLADVRLTFEGAQRLYSMAFKKLKSELFRREARLRKDIDREKSLRLLCDEREDELAYLRYEKKTEDLECLWSEVGQAKHECDELKARVDTQVTAKTNALAKAFALEVQLRSAHENGLVRRDMITRLEFELLKMKAKVVDTRAEAEAIQTKADKKVAVYLKDTIDTHAELMEALHRQSRSKEYVRCKSRRETLEEIHVRGFDLSEEIAQAKADEYGAKFLLSDVKDGEKEADRP